MVSVQNAVEARLALAAGANWIDAKDPTRGALHPVSPSVLTEILAVARGHCPISAAGGELLEFDPSDWNTHEVLSWLTYFKLGLSGCAARTDWIERWKVAWTALPAAVGRVAVIYADYQRAAAPRPSEIVAQALSSDCRAVLFDTLDKTAGDLFAHLSRLELNRLIQQVHAGGLLAVVGGSLTRETIPHAQQAGADVIAVRSAACVGERSGSIDRARVAALVDLVRGNCGATARKVAETRMA
jgi:uncharacterized protein (UPF0264 family)